ncbi:hypothetical protein AOZ07_01415 [Glutamicibacter halophytocola]|uniref:hypothetical protein n=1 Tax=Glutamicibacter halophytocola TaxID=1933880 RepID=UPI0006D4B89E|nr:hypothetical protein [Glutamicibacter halophytocola]ALG27787.1 hypothetical protein AOZ07_01415 [Glutamicibacter halophytocola]
MNLLHERLIAIQALMFPPTFFDGKIEEELNLSVEFVDSHVMAYGLVEELLAMVASSRTTYSEVSAFWKSLIAGSAGTDFIDAYSMLKRSEFGRIVVHMIDSAVHQK